MKTNHCGHAWGVWVNPEMNDIKEYEKLPPVTALTLSEFQRIKLARVV